MSKHSQDYMNMVLKTLYVTVSLKCQAQKWIPIKRGNNIFFSQRQH